MSYFICSWWIQLPRHTWEQMHTWRWVTPLKSPHFYEGIPLAAVDICSFMWYDGFCSSAREDIRRTVRHPRRCLECGHLFHGGWLFILFDYLILNHTLFFFNTFHMVFSNWQNRIRCMLVCSSCLTTCVTNKVLISALLFPALLSSHWYYWFPICFWLQLSLCSLTNDAGLCLSSVCQ